MIKCRYSIRWLIWLIVAVVSAVGLRNYRVDNDLAAWTPEHATAGPFPSYIVIGFERNAIDAGELTGRLRSRPSIALCIDPSTVEKAGWLAGVTPEDFVVGKDGFYLGVFAFSKPDTSDEMLVADVAACLAEIDRDRYAIGGPAVFQQALNKASQERLPVIVGAIVLLGGMLLWWTTGHLGTSLIATIAISISQVILLGLLSWQGQTVDMASSMVPPLMMSLGFSYAAHRAAGRSSLPMLLLCLITTAMGIASFSFTSAGPLRAFSVNGVLGLILVWLTVVTLVPRVNSRRNLSFLRPLLAVNIKCVTHHRKWILAGFFACVACTVLVGQRIRFETNPLNYFPRNSRVRRDFTELNNRLTGMLPFQFSTQYAANPHQLMADTPGVRKVIDISSFTDSDAHVLWCLADNDALPQLIESQQRWQAWASLNHTRFEWRGIAAQIANVGHVLTRTAIMALPLMIIVTGFVIGIVFRSWKFACAGMLVNTIPVMGLVAVAGIIKWPLDLPSLMIGAISIGVAIDDTLHLLRRFQQHHSQKRMIIYCWRPCVGSSLVATACMCLFVLSPFRPTAQFGLLMAGSIVMALLADFLLLPSLLKTSGKSVY